MRFCLDHWQQLREAIAARGLEHLVAGDGQSAAANLASAVESGATVANFDPLIYAHNSILANAIHLAGLAVLVHDENGAERCPLCFLTAAHRAQCTDPACRVSDFDHWIGRAADDAQRTWAELRRESQPEAGDSNRVE